MPAEENKAPPGYYMLFVVNAEGVPSVSRMEQVLPAIIGDFNGDGIIDEVDLTQWKSDFGVGADSDADDDGDSDGADFLMWQRQVQLPNEVAVGVSEPAAANLAVIFLGGLVSRRLLTRLSTSKR